MQPRPSLDRALLIAIAVGVVSILGIGWILLTSVFGVSLIPPTATQSSFSLSSPEARTRTPFPRATPSLEETPTATETPPAASLEPPTETLPSTSTVVTESLPTLSATPTPDPAQLLQIGKKYDDVEPNIAYDPSWTVLKNPGTENAYQGTLHASTNIGDEASFRFTGKGFRLGYQRGTNFGTVTVIIDDRSYGFHEQAFDLVWSSPQLSPGVHFVRIIHQSGESVNLDYIVILG